MSAAPPTYITNLVLNESSRFNLDPTLVMAVVSVESDFNPNAKSPVGAIGLMQIMPATAASMGYDPQDMWNPEKNIEAGTRYLRQLINRYGAMDEVLAHYNGAVTPSKKQEYLTRVYGRMSQFSIMFNSPGGVPLKGEPTPTFASIFSMFASSMKPEYLLAGGLILALIFPSGRRT
jgi:Transglycosylase SLT domain